MSNFDFLPPLVDFVEDKAKSFLSKNGMNGFDDLKKESKDHSLNVVDYINSLLNNLVEKVATFRQDTFNNVRDDFNEHYLK
jgi:hypothetical protein|uniref:Uncharacterized protein n=1 Tax=Siphoviridae sp. ctlIg4 TaxID=2825647 RepID=A0A8S5UAS9_9CAUD|nr:MAG TPA: hypothetical protein [Siphoviridae sp. ctlIg4]